MAVGTFGNIGDNGGFAGYFSGFDPIPDVQLNISGSSCFPGAVLAENTGPYDAYQWFNNGVAIPGATSSTYTPTELGDHYVRVTRGSCVYNSSIIGVFDCQPNIVVTKTDNQDPIFFSDITCFKDSEQYFCKINIENVIFVCYSIFFLPLFIV